MIDATRTFVSGCELAALGRGIRPLPMQEASVTG